MLREELHRRESAAGGRGGRPERPPGAPAGGAGARGLVGAGRGGSRGAPGGAPVPGGEGTRQLRGIAGGDLADAWIHEAVLAIRALVPLAVLRDTIHALPTYAEAYDVALGDLSTDEVEGR